MTLNHAVMEEPDKHKTDIRTCPSLNHCVTGSGKPLARHDKVNVPLILTFSSLLPKLSVVESPSICGGTEEMAQH